MPSGTSSMSSRKIVPPSAISKRPGRSLIAPVNAPRSWPKSSDSINVSENSAQLTATNGRWLRRLLWWTSVAVTSLPVPLSPVISTVLSLSPITRKNSKTARLRALLPTTRFSITFDVESVMIVTSRNAQRVELGYLFAQRRLDADVQRHVRRRTIRADAGQSNSGRISFHCHEFDIAAIGAQERPDAIEHGCNPFLGNHRDAPFDSLRSLRASP